MPAGVTSYSAQQVNSPTRCVAIEVAGRLVLKLAAGRLGLGDGAGHVLDKDQLALHVGAHVVGHDQIDFGQRDRSCSLPKFAQHSRLEPDPVVAAPGEARIGPRGRIAASGCWKNEVEQMDRALAVAGEIVAAHRAIGQIIVRALADAPVDDLIRDLGIGKGRQSAEAAAGGQLRAAKLAHGRRRGRPRGRAPRAARRPRAAPCMDRGWRAGPRSAASRPSGQPISAITVHSERAFISGQKFAEHLEAGGAGGDDLGLAQGCRHVSRSPAVTSSCRRAPAAPSAGAPQQSIIRPTPPGIFAAQMRVDALDVPGRRGR